jgi:hypothetical protein
MDADGTIQVYRTGDGPYYARSTDDGKTFSAAIPIVDRQSRKPGLEFDIWDLAIGKAGQVHVALGTNAWKLKLPEEEWRFHCTTLQPGAREFLPVRTSIANPARDFLWPQTTRAA